MPTFPVALLIEPHADTRTLYSDVLATSGWQTLEAADGATGVGLAIAKHPDAIVSETRLPRMDGLTVISVLKSDPHTARIPIIIVTGDAAETSRRRLCSAGADVVIAKPTTPDRIVNHVVEEYRRRRALICYEGGRLRARTGEVASTARRPVYRRDMLNREMGRYATTQPPAEPPKLYCPQCDIPLTYLRSHIGGVNAQAQEQWDYFTCARGCGTFQYRQRTRRLHRVA